MKYQVIRGFPFPKASWFSQKNIEDAMDYMPHDDDIIIASYPKTGTTWLQYIVFQILSKGEQYPTFDDTQRKFSPFMEMVGTGELDEMQKPRIYKHHIPYNMVKKNPKAKTLYVYRKPDDTCVSYYHFTQVLRPECDSLDEFFDSFVTGDISYGHYLKNVLSYLECKDEPNLLMVSYEKLGKNIKEEILRIAKFLGDEHYQPLVEDDALLVKIMERTSFDYMKKNLKMTYPGKEQANESQSKINFFRKGVVGDGKNVFTPEQLERLKNAAKEILKDYDFILKEWFGE